MTYALNLIATIVVAFAGGMVLNRILYKFFDWLLDLIERMDEKDY
jgi:hypothetical protein